MSQGKFTKIGILGNTDDPRVVQPMAALVELLRSWGLTPLLAADNQLDLDGERLAPDELDAAVDVLIAIGGDGTLLGAAAHAVRADVPLLGINRGRLGFLTDIRPDDMATAISAIFAGEGSASTRALLEATVTSQHPGKSSETFALNDIVVTRRQAGRMTDLHTEIDGHFVNEHAGDGLIVATPTGSTAYALSCGGPIIQPNADALVMIPICPHTLSDRPIVLDGRSVVTVKTLGTHDSVDDVTTDGNPFAELGPDDRLTIRAAERKLTLLHPPDYDYFELLRSKLNWGQSRRTPRGS